jgi:pimeloyl-ACP methyl ester carboxylesterase
LQKNLTVRNILLFLLLFTSVFSFGQRLEINLENLLQRITPEASTAQQTFNVKRIALKTGVELEYAEQGSADGIPVIFLHGLTDSWHSFETNLPHLPANIHAFAISQRGHGNSDKPSSAYTPKIFAADVAAFIEQQKLGPVVIVGHSMGGISAQRFAIDYPQLTRALVIIGADPAFVQNEGMSEFCQAVMSLRGPMSREFMTEFQRSTIMRPIDENYFELIVNEGLKVPTTVFQSAFKGLIEENMINEVKTITKPTLIFWGEDDLVCRRPGQETLKKSIKSSQWIEYYGTGHALHWEQPTRFAHDLVQFINSLQSK